MVSTVFLFTSYRTILFPFGNYQCCVSGSDLTLGSGFLFDADLDPDADPDLTFHPDADPEPDSSFKMKVQTFEKSSQRGSYSVFWLVICKLMRIWIRIHLSL
jgi:hypothetical protein